MTASASKAQQYFALAFELAYYIHVNKEVAFFIAEDALDGLSLMLGYHQKNRKASYSLRGFLKSGERTRPLRKTVTLNEPQMLQWLVYKESEVWERQTERGEGLYQPTEEDLIVRYLVHLILLSLRSGSFYVTLAVGPLLYQFDRRETRLFYDVLTQSDSARMKDTNYIGKRRLELLEKVARRFGDMVQVVTNPGNEKLLVMQATTEEMFEVVAETLRRLTPWETHCLLKPGFDVIDIPGLYFSEANAPDEDVIEMNRIHTVVDPTCLAIFAQGLSRYVRTLPEGDQDNSCRYDLLETRLKIPKFFNVPVGPSRGDRFQSPKLAEEDRIRLQRTLNARAHRRKGFNPQQLSIYIDDVLTCSFDPHKSTSGHCVIRSGASLVEVRGKDAAGELLLATLLLTDDQMSGGTFEDTVIHEGGQEITTRVEAVDDPDHTGPWSRLEVRYRQHGLGSRISGLAQRIWLGLNEDKENISSARNLKWVAAVALMLIIATSALIWWRLPLRPPQDQPTHSEGTGEPQRHQRADNSLPVPSVTPTPLPRETPGPRETRMVVARAHWSVDRDAAFRAVPLEATRGESPVIEARDETNILLSISRYDDQGRTYSTYRFSLSTSGKRLWQQTLGAPNLSLTGHTHILDLMIFTRRLTEAGPYILKVEGISRGRWQQVGTIRFNRKES
ncbi:MAG TPA: hypothetical protein VIT88_02830 [Pyrinomonadaceae bacterium]